MKTFIQHSLFIMTLSLSTIVFGQDNKMLILAPQNNDVLHVSQTMSSINVLIAVDEKIDSTCYKITFMNSMRQKVTQEFWAIEDPYTLEMPVNIGEYSQQIEVTTYYKGKVSKKEKCQVFFTERKEQQFGYLSK